MRFASLGGQSNYAQAAKAVADDARKSFKAARENSPDYGELAQRAMVEQSKENIAKEQNAARLKVNDNRLEQRAIVSKSRRKAGVVAAMGKAGLGMADAFMGKPEKRDHSASLALEEKLKSGADKIRAGIKPIDLSSSTSTSPTNTGGTGASNASNTTGGLTSSAQALASGKGSAGTGGKYDLSKMTDYAIQGGFSPENARTMAAISMGESGGNAGIDTVQSGLDPNKSNEYSIGLAQINVQAHGDKLARRGWTENDLRDPVKNMTIAKEVYDEVGSFKPWSVYQKGLHHQYLQ